MLRGIVFVLALSGSVLAIDGSVRASETEDPTEADVDVAQEAPDGAAAGQSLEARRQQRQAFREARRQTRLDRTPTATQRASPDKALAPAASPGAAALSGIEVSFKLDSAQGPDTGARWVPPAYAGVQQGAEFTVEAKAWGLDAAGKTTTISPAWVAADPNMVEVSPGTGEAVKITVRDAGQSKLIVAAPGVAKELSISAISAGQAMHVQISQ